MNSANPKTSAAPRGIDLAVFALFLCAAVVFKHETLRLGLFWDEIYAYVNPSITLSRMELWRALPGLHEGGVFYGHPPALFLIVAATYKLFSGGPLATHLLTITAAALCIFGTYKLVRRLSNAYVGVASGILLFFSPLFYAQSGICTADIFTAMFGIWTLYYYLEERFVLYAALGLCLAMTKLTAIGIFAPLLVYDCAVRNRLRDLDFKRVLVLSIPLLATLCFFLAQLAATGKFVPNNYFNDKPFFADLSLMPLAGKFLVILKLIFIENLRFATTALMALTIIKNTNNLRRTYVLFLMIIIFFAAAFSAMFFLPRYVTPLLPFYYCMATISLFYEIKSAKLSTAISILLLGVYLFSSYNYGSLDGRYDSTMKYADFVRLQQEAARFIETHYKDPALITEAPFEIAVTNPLFGYVQSPVRTTREYRDADTAAFFTKPNKNRYDAAAFISNGFVFVKKFSSGSLELYIFRKPPKREDA